jgi:two-component system LytT family response regulator
MHPGATLHAGLQGERFVAEVRLPLTGLDAWHRQHGVPALPCQARIALPDRRRRGTGPHQPAPGAGRPSGLDAGGECDGTAAAREALARHEVDLVFLDIQMPGESGLVLARELSRLREPPLIVFVTAYSEHALDAFEVHALDYLLKPLDDARLAHAVERSAAMLGQRQREAYGAALRDYVDAGPRRGVRSTSTCARSAASSASASTTSCGSNRRATTSSCTWPAHGPAPHHAQPLETLLDATRFLRVHRGAIVRRDQIAQPGHHRRRHLPADAALRRRGGGQRTLPGRAEGRHAM